MSEGDTMAGGAWHWMSLMYAMCRGASAVPRRPAVGRRAGPCGVGDEGAVGGLDGTIIPPVSVLKVIRYEGLRAWDWPRWAALIAGRRTVCRLYVSMGGAVAIGKGEMEPHRTTTASSKALHLRVDVRVEVKGGGRLSMRQRTKDPREDAMRVLPSPISPTEQIAGTEMICVTVTRCSSNIRHTGVHELVRYVAAH